MFRVSTLLKNTRLDKELEYSEVSKKLKIPAKYIEAIENEQIKNFPAEPYCSLIVKDYANFLGLNGEEILSIFRRDFDRKVTTSSKVLSKTGITPQLTFSVFVVISIIGFIIYLVLEYMKFNRPPKLQVEWPSNPTTPSAIEIKGQTDPEATVRINQDLVIIQPSGTFSKKVLLEPPETKITVESTSQSGKSVSDEKIYQVKN